VENTVLITVLESLRARGGTAYGYGPPLLGWWMSAGCVAGAFVCTPPFPALLSVLPGQDGAELAKALAAGGWRLPGVTARRESAEAFATSWSKVTGVGYEIWERRRLHWLNKLQPPATAGRSRLAGPGDRRMLLEWYDDAEREIAERPGDHVAAIDDRLAYGGLTLWEVNGTPVALAGRSRMTAGMVRIAPVYTPPEHRRRGYAAAVTAAVSQSAADIGAENIVIFADLADPASNSVCQRIGYQPLDDYLIISFTAGNGEAH